MATRKRQFFSLSELNAAIAVEIAALNARRNDAYMSGFK
jgi:hypothetical protein